MKIKPESEISSHITLMSVISGLFHTRHLHWSRFLVTQGVKLAKTHQGLPTTPADIIAAALCPVRDLLILPGQNEPYLVIFPLFAVRLICLFFFYLLIVNLLFYLIITFTPFHASCTPALPFTITLHNNSNQAFSDISLVPCSPSGLVFYIYTGWLAHPISQSLVL